LAGLGSSLFPLALHIDVIYPSDMERQSEQVQVRLESLNRDQPAVLSGFAPVGLYT
jgi:hypothetical protein